MASQLLVLASSSPRRQELIQLLQTSWTIQVANVDEESVTHPDPATNVAETARLKAAAAAKTAPDNSIVIGADTTVALDGEMLNKPADEEEARKMLQALRNRSHQVHTGIAIIDTSSGKVVLDVCSVVVPMRDYSSQEIDAYIATGDPLDKAGAYAIQHPEFQPVNGLNGCYATVVGLPLCHLVRSLRKVGLEISADIATSCQKHHNYECPVFDQILN
jgi:septum formation protein